LEMNQMKIFIRLPLKTYLKNFHKYCNTTDSLPLNLWCDRDNDVLTSAQACVLPTVNGKVEFAVDLYNYQSPTEPAVLVIMATAYGTSAQVVCGGNTVLYFNANQTSRTFKAERLTVHRINQGKSTDGPMTLEEKALNGIYIFQVPLKIEHKARSYSSMYMMRGCASLQSFGSKNESAMNDYDDDVEFSMFDEKSKGMERAILSLGEEKGPYKGILNNEGTPYKLVRDTDRPIRLTVQFYMCSDTADITNGNVKEISEQIRKIYNEGLNEGSLVVDHPVPKPGVKIEDKVKTRPTATTTPFKGSFMVNDHSNIL